MFYLTSKFHVNRFEALPLPPPPPPPQAQELQKSPGRIGWILGNVATISGRLPEPTYSFYAWCFAKIYFKEKDAPKILQYNSLILILAEYRTLTGRETIEAVYRNSSLYV